MLAFISPLTTIYLVVISIIYHVHAPPNPELVQTDSESEQINQEMMQSDSGSEQINHEMMQLQTDSVSEQINQEMMQLQMRRQMLMRMLTDSESEQTNQGLVQMQTNQELVQMANPELVQICQRILNEFGLFKDSDDAGPLNFLIAFKMLSLTQIEHDLSEPEEENQRRHGRIRGQVRHYVVKEYFLDLLYNHRITAVSQLKTPRQWCEERLKQVNYDPEIHRNKREQMADCLVYTNKLVQNPSHRNNPDLIFQAMYTDWCNNDIRLLLYSDGLYLLSDSAYDTYKKKLNYNVEYFTEEYFYYYGQVLHSLDHTQGNFRSINQYCEDVGYRLLQGVVL